jgi:pyruvate formate lyase activating enzyme
MVSQPHRVLLKQSKFTHRSQGNIGAEFTYNEPMIGFEYVRDGAKEVRGRGMKNVVVTSGSVSLDAL